MKLSEISADDNMRNLDTFFKELDKCCDPKSSITRENGEIFCNCDVDLNDSYKIGELKQLPFSIKEVHGYFDASNTKLQTMKNFPSIIHQDFACAPNITSFEFAPEIVGASVFISNCNKITSLEGIADHFKRIGGHISVNFSNIKSGGLGFLNIKYLKGLTYFKDGHNLPLPAPFKIIDDCIKNGIDIFECQTLLIDAGFEEFAKL